jgi:hypothetical protein
MFEIGSALLNGAGRHLENTVAVGRAVALHKECCEGTKRAIRCWIWVAKQKHIIVKAVRGIVCKMLWGEKVARSERQSQRGGRMGTDG